MYQFLFNRQLGFQVLALTNNVPVMGFHTFASISVGLVSGCRVARSDGIYILNVLNFDKLYLPLHRFLPRGCTIFTYSREKENIIDAFPCKFIGSFLMAV